MREWFESLDLRERVLVCIGALVVAATLYFVMIWQPLAQARERLGNEVVDARDLNLLMREAEAVARAARGRGGRPVSSSNRSLLAVVDETSKQANLGAAVKRIQPEGDRTVRLWLEQAPFDGVVNWLADLERLHGIRLSNGSLDRDSSAGRIKARLTLERSS